MRQISLKGVAIGGIVDVVSSSIAGVPLIIFAMGRSNISSLPEGQRVGALVAALHTPGMGVVTWVIGAACSVLGGYVAARIAKRAEVMNGALSAWLCILMGVYGMVSDATATSPLHQLANFLLSPALSALGGYLRLRQVSQPDDPPLGPAVAG
jgi:hypothetical protein